jgi:serine/threonine protein kinase
MPYCETTLRTLILEVGPRSQAIALMVQALRALSYARRNCLLAHQDLKPENVLLQDLRNRYDLPAEYPFPWRPRVADFGNANGYNELRVPWGSRPYQAPEQFDSGSDLTYVDIFACGVMFHELITGRHPLGLVTSHVWSAPVRGQSSQWQKAKRWRRWANSPSKLAHPLPPNAVAFEDLLESVLATDPLGRPNHAQFEMVLRDELKRTDQLGSDNLEVLLSHYDNLCRESEEAGDSDERYQEQHVAALLRRP